MGNGMKKSEQFRLAIEKLESKEMYSEQEAEYMSDMSHWCAVHATKYMPLKRRDGSLYIPSTGMATDFVDARATVHTTLNHIVRPVAMGMGNDWDNMPIIVLMPYNDVVKQNGNPAQVAGVDTYWSVNPDAGLVLPKSAYIVQPDNNGPLYKIGKNGATYKRDNYTDEEIKMIESLLSPYEKEEYDKYANGDFNEFDIKYICDGDERVKKMYESSKDKKAFLRGLFEETRFDMLSCYLRKAVARMVMDKMGFQYVNSIGDGGITSEAIANTADAQDIPATASEKGHEGSVYGKMDHIDEAIRLVLYGNRKYGLPGILKAQDFAGLYQAIDNRTYRSGNTEPVIKEVVKSIVENKPIDFMWIYQKEYDQTRHLVLERTQYDYKDTKERLDGHINRVWNESEDNRDLQIKRAQDILAKLNKSLKRWDGKTTIAKFDKNLDKTIRRHCEKLNAEFEAWRNALSKRYGYDKFIESLRSNFYGDDQAKNWYVQSGREM